MIKRNVTVVGASAAGLFLADKLARDGVSVVVLERARSIDPAPRTLIVTPRVRDLLNESLQPSIVNTIRSYELHANGYTCKIALETPDVVIDRTALVRTLAEHAVATGVRLDFGSRFTGVHPGRGGLVVTTTTNSVGTKEFHTETIVGADGAHSAVARSAGWPRLPTAPLIQAVVRLPLDLCPDTTRVWFRPNDTPYFYWLIPETEDTGVLGLIGEEPRAVRAHLDRFLDEQGLVPLSYQAARIPTYERWTRPHRRLGTRDVFLVGDAAGHVKVSTVGGIHTGFRGAKAVADLLLQGDHREMRLLRRELGRHLLLRRSLSRFAEDDYRSLLGLLENGTKKTLAKYTRDDSQALLWRLAAREPRLVLLGLRSLVSRASVPRTSGRAKTGSLVEPDHISVRQ